MKYYFITNKKNLPDILPRKVFFHWCPVKNNRFFAVLRMTVVCDELGEGGLSRRRSLRLSPPKNPNSLSF